MLNAAIAPEWLIVDHSATGKSHIKDGTPCQDNRYIIRIDRQWGVAVCCDGAGSRARSELGSKFTAKQTAKLLTIAIEKWRVDQRLPDPKEWKKLSIQVLYQVYSNMEIYSKKQNLDIGSLACTVIAILYSPMGLLVTHIGDGRAAYCNQAGEWKSIIKPFKGKEANQTVFITSKIWHDVDRYIESNVIEDKPYGFTLLSDGCEGFSFLTHTNISKDNETIKLVDINQPFDGFYQPVTRHLKTLYGENIPQKSIQKEWVKILESGTDKIKHEPDDKTMILGLLI